ncbi:MAG: hypothetical protein WC179_05045 [Candidatus Cloacimonadaceae bacterium]
MGLDQYLNKRIDGEMEEVEYWRKNNQLQGWFERNYNQENCVPTPITKELVDKLLDDLETKNLPTTEGFFYGSFFLEPDEYEELIDIFTKVRQDIIDNNAEYEYNCWY